MGFLVTYSIVKSPSPMVADRICGWVIHENMESRNIEEIVALEVLTERKEKKHAETK
jgi:hypothetical protein